MCIWLRILKHGELYQEIFPLKLLNVTYSPEEKELIFQSFRKKHGMMIVSELISNIF
jgi:hypothetical protein